MFVVTMYPGVRVTNFTFPLLVSFGLSLVLGTGVTMKMLSGKGVEVKLVKLLYAITLVLDKFLVFFGLTRADEAVGETVVILVVVKIGIGVAFDEL